MKFTLVAINLNQHKYCQLFLDSIKHINYDQNDFEVIIVDDGSTPPIAEKISEAPPNVRFTYSPRTQNSSRAKARNLGASLALGEFLVFVDGDCIIGQNCLLQYEDYFKGNPAKNVVIGSYCHLSESEVPLRISKDFLVDLDNLDPYNRHDNRFKLLKINNAKLSEINPSWLLFVSRNFCIRKSLFDNIQGFDESFLGWGSEDTEFAYRLIKNNHHFDLIPNKVFHVSESELHGINKEKYSSWMQNIGIFYSIHKDPKILLLLLQEKLIHDCFYLGNRWDVDLQIHTFQTIKSRMSI
jgi:glycosyltransferase involved in cell wall biosynthesis